MKLLVFGASGATGRELVKQALAHGHNVTAFVRSPAKLAITHKSLSVLQGDVTDVASVARAVAGQDAVISALGNSKPLHRDPAVVDGVRHILQAMEQAGVRRFIYLSFVGVSESRQDAGLFIRYVAARLLRHEIADHELKEDLTRRSPVDWTIVRPPKLINGPGTGVYRSGEHLAARSVFPALSRADVAHFMLQQLTDRSFVRKAPNVMR